MSLQKQQFGIMDEGYFVPKSEILAWINNLLHINITKIEALGSGSIYCQIFDVIHPGKIMMSKINWKAKNDTEFLANFRLLQTACEKIGIKRHIEVQKLVKAKYQDNLQFIQWFKRYFDTNCGNKGEGYDAVEKRNKVVPDFSFCEKTVVPKVYNASGQVAPKQKVSSPNAKKEQAPPRLKSPRAIKTPVVTSKKTPVVTEKKEQKKEEPKVTQVKKPEIKKTDVKKPQVKKPEIKPEVPPKTSTPIVKRPNTATQHVEPIKKVVEKKVDSNTEALNKKIKDLTQKLQMIKEIVISQDGSEMKVQMIKEVLSIANEKPKTQQAQQILQNHIHKKIQGQKQEAQPVNLVEDIPSTHEDLLINDEPQPEKVKTEEPPIEQITEKHQQEELLQEDTHQQELAQPKTHQEQAHQEELPQPEAHQEEVHQQEIHQEEAQQEQSQPEEKPDFSQSQAAQAQQDDDEII